MTLNRATLPGPVLQLLLLAVFVLPSLVPTGYMAQLNPETSLVEVTICSGVNHRNAWVDVSTGEYFADKALAGTEAQLVEVVDTELCPFAAGGAVAFDETELPTFAGVSHLGFACCQPGYSFSDLYLPPARAPPAIS